MKYQSQRGAVLVVSLVFSVIIAISLTSYLKLASASMSLAHRSFLANEAINIAEAGLEQALWSFNQANDGKANAWSSTPSAGNTGWLQGITANDRKNTFSGFSLSQGATGRVDVYVQNFNSTGTTGAGNNPVAVAKATITPTQGPPISKYLVASFQRRSFFGTGLVARNGLIFKGNNATVDSWNSTHNDDGSLRATPVPYYYNSSNPNDPKNNRRPYGTIAAVNVDATISVQNANIYGYVSVGSSSETSISIGSQGSIGNFSTPSGTKDPNHIATNFTSNLPDVVLPTYTVVNTYNAQQGRITGKTTLPKGGDQPSADGKYYYLASVIDQGGNRNNNLLIEPNRKVVILLSAPEGTNAVTMSGGGGIVLSQGATLAIYTAGNIDITGVSDAGGGIRNENAKPESFEIWGTSKTAGEQKIRIEGNGSLRGIVGAPFAATTINGNGEVSGSFIANTIELTGNANFHYDESLATFGGNNPFKVAKWRELISATDRAIYATQLNSFRAG